MASMVRANRIQSLHNRTGGNVQAAIELLADTGLPAAARYRAVPASAGNAPTGDARRPSKGPAKPTANGTSARQPIASAARSGDAKTCRTSPTRHSPVTIGAGALGPNVAVMPSARSLTDWACPVAT